MNEEDEDRQYFERFTKHDGAVAVGACSLCGRQASYRHPLWPVVGFTQYDSNFYCGPKVSDCGMVAFKRALDQHLAPSRRLNEAYLEKRDADFKNNPPDPDPDHPNNLCYQCHRPLPHNYFMLEWNRTVSRGFPMFDTQRCNETAIRRHLRGDIDDDDVRSEAISALYDDYRSFVHRYENGKKEQQIEQQAKTLVAERIHRYLWET